jgi:hypothetical protein
MKIASINCMVSILNNPPVVMERTFDHQYLAHCVYKRTKAEIFWGEGGECLVKFVRGPRIWFACSQKSARV